MRARRLVAAWCSHEIGTFLPSALHTRRPWTTPAHQHLSCLNADIHPFVNLNDDESGDQGLPVPTARANRLCSNCRRVAAGPCPSFTGCERDIHPSWTGQESVLKVLRIELAQRRPS